MKKIILITMLLVALSLNAVNWDCRVDVTGVANIDTNINTFKNNIINGANNVFENATVIIDIRVDGSLMITVSITGELSENLDLEANKTLIKNYFYNLLQDTVIDISYSIKLKE